MCVLRSSFSNVFNVDYKSEAFSFLVSSQASKITHEMVLRGLSSPGQVKTRLLRPSSELATVREQSTKESLHSRFGERHQNRIKSLCLETINEGRNPLECL